MGFLKYRCEKLEKGLYLEERAGRVTYLAKALLHKKYWVKNTGFSDIIPATKFARSWFRTLRNSFDGTPEPGLFLDASKRFIATINNATTRDFYARKDSALRDHFRNVYLSDVTYQFLQEFLQARRDGAWEKENILSTNTLHKDLVFIRQVLKWAFQHQMISHLPPFPTPGKIIPNPRPWLGQGEWDSLRSVALDRIAQPGLNRRTKEQREELLDFMVMMVYSCARVSELRRVKVRDCQIRPDGKFEGLHIQLYKGKTNGRLVIAWQPAIEAFARLKARGDLKENDLLFKSHHADAFRALLVAADLLVDGTQNKRNLKCLRSTGIMFRVLHASNNGLPMDSIILGRLTGTSAQMMDQYYLKPLTVQMNAKQLSAKSNEFFLMGRVGTALEDDLRAKAKAKAKARRAGKRNPVLSLR